MSQKPKKQAPKPAFNRAMAVGRLPVPLEMPTSRPGTQGQHHTTLGEKRVGQLAKGQEAEDTGLT